MAALDVALWVLMLVLYGALLFPPRFSYLYTRRKLELRKGRKRRRLALCCLRAEHSKRTSAAATPPTGTPPPDRIARCQRDDGSRPPQHAGAPHPQ